MREGYRFGELSLVADLSPARWLIEQIHGFAENIGSLVPATFPAYVRVLHPAYRHDAAQPNSDLARVTWAEVARAHDWIIHPEVQFESLVGRVGAQEEPGIWDRGSDEGTLPADLIARLAAVLGRYTATPEQCWFAVWEGWGDLGFRSLGAPTFPLPGRRYFLFAGPLSAATRSFDMAGMTFSQNRSANLCWPDDHAWCVATEIDLNSTYVGCSDACAAELLATDGLEALPARITDGATWDSDRINPLPS